MNNIFAKRGGITVLSLCDGMSGGQIALKEVGIPVRKYFSCEIKSTAIQTTQLNFPNTIQLGDVNEFDISQLEGEQIDLFLCGSPCQDMSLINSNKVGVNGKKSSLLYKCVEILKQTNPKYFLFENVGSMTNADKEVFNREIEAYETQFGEQPYLIMNTDTMRVFEQYVVSSKRCQCSTDCSNLRDYPNIEGSLVAVQTTTADYCHNNKCYRIVTDNELAFGIVKVR